MANPYFGTIPRSSSLGNPTIPYNQLLRAYPRITSVSMYRNNTGTTNYHGFSAKLEQRLSRGLSLLVSYTQSSLEDDASSVFDASILTGPVASYPVADSFDWSRERDSSTGDIPHVFAVSAVWLIPVGRGQTYSPDGIVGAIVSDWSLPAPSRCSPACRSPSAGDQQQPVRRLRRAAAQHQRQSGAAGRRAFGQPVVQHERVQHRAAVHVG